MNISPTVIRCPRRREHGQAMVEFLVSAMFFLLPLFLGMVVVAKFADVQHVANMTARYAAWERTVWYDDAGTDFNGFNASNQKSAAQIRNESAVRLINDRHNGVSIKDNDKRAASFANGMDAMWRDNAGKVYLASFDQHAATVVNSSPSRNIANGAIEWINKVPLPKGVTGKLVPPVPLDTFAVAEVSLTGIGKNSQAYKRLWPDWTGTWAGLDFKATGAILSNTWAANGSGATHKMVAESVPTAKGLGTAINTIVKATMKSWDPDAPEPEFGKIAPDVVPEDRLRTTR